MSSGLRAWQAEALEKYFTVGPRDFLAVATPGAGKTTFALRAAVGLLSAGVVDKVVVATPTEHLKTQWAEAAHRVGLPLDPTFTNGHPMMVGCLGPVVTYAQVAAAPELHAGGVARGRSLVIMDEVHHAGDNLSWGDAVRTAYGPATRRLALTGTPFRSDVNPIPFITYAPDAAGARRSVADYTYGYAQALADDVVRPVVFLAYSGQTRWRSAAGVESEATLGDESTGEIAKRAWRTALDPSGQWIPAVLAAADRRLSEVRAGGMPDAGGLVIASNQTHARAYAKHLRELTGQAPTVVLSDDAKANDKIAEFAADASRWMVAVRMVSEGVDVPRLAVGVYATSTATPLFFTQAIGRFVRARRPGETATVFLPSVRPLLAMAAELEAARDHVLDRGPVEDGLDDALLEEANRSEKDTGGDAQSFEALDSDALMDRVIYNGAEFGTLAAPGSAAESDYLSLPGVLDPALVVDLLRERDGVHVPVGAGDGGRALYRQLSDARRELSRLVARRSHATGEPHAVIHAQLRAACGGGPVAVATLEQIQHRIDAISRVLRRAS